MDEHELADDPLIQFESWLDEARAMIPQAEAMTLATASVDRRPSARVVLLRDLDDRGFVFYTNRSSRKGDELAANPRAALVFHWYELGRQVRVEGNVEDVDTARAMSYWTTRPRGSQIAAWASPQSRPLAGRDVLDRLFAEAQAKLGEGGVPLPEFWGGYRVVPDAVEFWQHQENRLHDRVRYVRTKDGWRRERLAP